jgi:hypothetical protein
MSQTMRVALVVMAGLAGGTLWGQPVCDPTPTPGDPIVLAELHVWHGLDSHSAAFCADWIPACRAYDSRDAAVIESQVESAQAMGIDGFVVDWYGPSAPGLANDTERAFQDAATQTLFDVAEDSGFCVAILYDEGALRDSGLPTTDYMQQAASDLSYADVTYLSSSAYLPLAGNPALFVFPYGEVDDVLDWSVLRGALSSHEVTLLDQDPKPEDPGHDDWFDGFFAWVQPGASGWDVYGREWGRDYLRWFYSTMDSPAYAGKATVGGVWPGFDDLLAPWGQDRFMARAEDPWTETWALATEYEAEVVLIATWNDFEEGTDIEYGVEMEVAMDDPMPDVLVRSTPLEVVWDPGLGPGVLQVYHGGDPTPIYDEGPQQQPVPLALFEPEEAYEIKLWLGPAPLTQAMKIRSRDPHPAHIFSDGFESGDLGNWSTQP